MCCAFSPPRSDLTLRLVCSPGVNRSDSTARPVGAVRAPDRLDQGERLRRLGRIELVGDSHQGRER